MEKNYTELQNFSLDPNKQIWNEIEKQLPQEKKKRIVGWWWSVPIILGLGFGIYQLAFNEKSNKKNTNIETTLLPIKANTNNQIKIENIAINNLKTIENKNEFKINKTAGSLTKKPALVLVKNSKALIKLNTLKEKDEEKESNNIVAAINKLTPQNVKNEGKKIEDVEVKINTTIVENTVAENKKSDSIIKTNNLEIALTIPKKSTAKKINYSLSFTVGTNYCSYNNTFNKQENISINNPVNAGTSITPTNSSTQKIQLPSAGFQFAAGVNMQYQLSKKWALQTGILFRHIENKITLTKDSLTTFSANYYVGNNIEYKNYSNQFEVPLSLQYCLNANAKNKISLLAGLNMAYILNDNWLAISSSSNEYYLQQKQNNRLLLGLQTGINYSINNKINLSLIARKYITPTVNNSLKYYWQQIDFQINIPFNYIKK